MRTDVQEIDQFADLVDLDLLAGLGGLGRGWRILRWIDQGGHRLRLNLPEVRVLAGQEPAAAIALAAGLAAARGFTQDQLREMPGQGHFPYALRPVDQERLREVLQARQQLFPGAGGPRVHGHGPGQRPARMPRNSVRMASSEWVESITRTRPGSALATAR